MILNVEKIMARAAQQLEIYKTVEGCDRVKLLYQRTSREKRTTSRLGYHKSCIR